MGELPAREYVLYLRKSRGWRGIAEQRARTTTQVRRIGGSVSGEFCDEDSTAFQQIAADAPPPRDDFYRLLDYLRAHPGAGVCADHADRLLRNLTDTEALIKTCARGDCPVMTSEGIIYDLTTSDGRDYFRHAALKATGEVDRMTERIRKAKAAAAANGDWLGGRRPFGYTRDGMALCHSELPVTGAEAQRRGIVPSGTVMTRQGERLLIRLPYDEAAELAAATARVLAGESVHAIARWWNERGVRTASGRTWENSTVRPVLLRPRNAGLATHRGKITGPAAWPAILDELTWRKVCIILTDPDRRTTPGPARKWLGSGLYRCGVCGSVMLATATGPRNGRPARPVYRCRASRAHVARDAASLDAWTGLVISDLIASPRVLRRLRSAGPRTRPLERELAGIRDGLDEIARQAGAGLIDVRQMSIASKGLRERAAQLEQAISGASRAGVLATLTAGAGPVVWDELTLDGQRTLLEALVTVTILPAPKGRPAGWRPGMPYLNTDYIRIEATYETTGG